MLVYQKDATTTTFYEGLWAVGKNSNDSLALSLMMDTEGLGMPMNIFGFYSKYFSYKRWKYQEID